MQGFWGEQRQDAFFDVRVFNPHVSSNRCSFLEACYRKHEKEKRRSYDQRVREVERGTFAPFVFSATGGMGPAALTVYKRLASKISEKSRQSYSTTMGWTRCRLSYSLLRSAILCIRGSQSSYHRPICPPEVPIDVIAREGRVTKDPAFCGLLRSWRSFIACSVAREKHGVLFPKGGDSCGPLLGPSDSSSVYPLMTLSICDVFSITDKRSRLDHATHWEHRQQ